MKEKIVVINFESEYAHFLAKSIRFLGYYSEIQNPNISLNDLENTKGIIFARKNDENFTSIISELNEQITNLNIPILDLGKEKNFSTKSNDNKFLENFIKTCNFKKNWEVQQIFEYTLEKIKTETINKNVLLFLTGEFKSTVIFALLNKVLGKERVLGLHINNGFLRENEIEIITQQYINLGFTNFILEDESEVFLSTIQKIINPQEKQQIIDKTFLEVHNKIFKKLNLLENQWILAQEKTYPDVIEFGKSKFSHGIKINHNKIAEIQSLISKGLIIEPLNNLYNEEIILIGKTLGLPENLICLHPFSSQGLSVNTLCSNDVLSSQEERDIKKINQNLTKIDLSSFFNINDYSLKALPVKSIGKQSVFNTNKFPAILTLKSKNLFNWDLLEKASEKILEKNFEVNRVILSIYEKENCCIQEQFCTKERLDQIRKVDKIVIDELKTNNEYDKIFQHFTINVPYSCSKNSCSIVLRPIISENVVTAKFAKLSTKTLNNIVEKIQKLDFVDALYYDITNNTPISFGWE